MLAANLLPMSRRRHAARVDRAAFWAVFVGVVACVLGLATAAVRHSTRSTTAAATARELAAIEREQGQLTKLLDESRSRAQKAESLLAAARAIADHPDWSLLLNLLGKLRGDQVDLARVALGYRRPDPGAKAEPRQTRGYWVRITGQALDQAAVARFAVRLEDAGLFDRVALTESRKGAGDAALIDFQIEAFIEDAGGAK